jgi:hypothetical protein
MGKNKSMRMLMRNKRKTMRMRNKRKTMRIKLKNKKTYRRTRHRGGYGPGAGPVGFAWEGKDPNTWPGVAGVDNQSNFLPLSKYGVPAGGALNLPENTSETNMKMSGGGLSDLLPQDIVNFGRSLTGGLEGVLYGYQGVDRPISAYPSPTNQPGINENFKYIDSSPPNIKSIHLNAGRHVASL